MGATPQIYVGIDLSTSDGKTGVCRINWDDETMELDVASRLPVDQVLDDEFTAAGIDVPFGWPVDFVEATCAWTARSQPGDDDGSDACHDGQQARTGPDNGDPGGHLDADLFRDGYESAGERLRFRATDRFVRKAMKADAPEKLRSGWPSGLSVTKDMITGTALHAMHLLGCRYPDLTVGHPFETANHPVVEVYPAIALRGWGLEAPPYKDKEGKAGRRCILEQLEEVPPLDRLINDNRIALEKDDNLLDAFVCALVARSWHRGHTHLPDDEYVAELMEAHCGQWFDQDRFLDEVRREGWIAHPNAQLALALSWSGLPVPDRK